MLAVAVGFAAAAVDWLLVAAAVVVAAELVAVVVQWCTAVLEFLEETGWDLGIMEICALQGQKNLRL